MPKIQMRNSYSSLITIVRSVHSVYQNVNSAIKINIHEFQSQNNHYIKQYSKDCDSWLSPYVFVELLPRLQLHILS